MGETPRLIPVWLLVVVIVIVVFLCSSCRGGRSLGKGSAGTVIVPQTPQEINERNRQPPPKIALPPLEPLPPVTVIPESPTPPAVPAKAVRSTPTLPESNSVEANPVIINPKPAGKLKPFSPSVSPAPIITAPEKNPPTDNTATDSETAGKSEGLSEEKSYWSSLTYYYLFLFIAMIFGWVVYDVVQTHRLRNALESKTKKKTAKKPAKATRASRKKALSKKNEKPK